MEELRNRAEKETSEWICYLTIPDRPLSRMEICGAVPVVGPSHQYLNGLVCGVYKVDSCNRTRWRVYMPRTAVGLALTSARHKGYDLNVVKLTTRSAAGSETEGTRVRRNRNRGLGGASPSRPDESSIVCR